MEKSSNQVIALLGPTNTGKTFVAIEKMLKYESGIFGFPLRTKSNGKIEIIQGIELNEFAQTKIKVTTEELESEREAVSDLIS